MSKKGFTLVELLAVIVLLGIISVLIVPKVSDSISNSKNKAYEAQVASIKKGVTDFFIENSSLFSTDGIFSLTLGTIKQGGYLPVNIKNPITRKNFSNESRIRIIKDGDIIDIELDLEDLVDVTDDYNVDFPILVLNGEYIEYVDVNSEYNDLGATAKSSDGDDIASISSQIYLNGEEVYSVDVTNLNTYNIVYSATDNDGNTVSATRTVIVRDNEAPVISVPNETVININNVDSFNLLDGVIITDNYDADVAIKVDSELDNVVGNYVVTYTAVDSSLNQSIERRIINVTDSLPSSYQYLNYIMSNGNQYIIFDYAVKTNTELRLDFEFVENQNTYTDSANNSFIGRDNISSINTFTSNFGSKVSQNKQIYFWLDTTYASGATTYVQKYDSVLNRSIMSLKSGSVNFKGIQTTTAVKSNNNSSNLVLFGTLVSDGITMAPFNRYDIKLYGFKIYEDEVLIKDMVPCYHKDNGIVGLYDIVNNKFYSSNTNVSFIKG